LLQRAHGFANIFAKRPRMKYEFATEKEGYKFVVKVGVPHSVVLSLSNNNDSVGPSAFLSSSAARVVFVSDAPKQAGARTSA